MRLGHEDIETIIRSQFKVNIDDDNIESVHFITTLLWWRTFYLNEFYIILTPCGMSRSLLCTTEGRTERYSYLPLAEYRRPGIPESTWVHSAYQCPGVILCPPRYYLVIQSESVVTGQWWKSGSCRPWWHCRVTVWCSGQCTMENSEQPGGYSYNKDKISSFLDILGL